MGQWGWVWVRPPSLPLWLPERYPSTCDPRSAGRLASSTQPGFLSPRIDVVYESGLFSLGCGNVYSEKIGLELFGAQL